MSSIYTHNVIFYQTDSDEPKPLLTPPLVPGPGLAGYDKLRDLLSD